MLLWPDPRPQATGHYCPGQTPGHRPEITGAVLLALVMLFTKVKQALSQEFASEPRITSRALALMFGIGLWLGLIVIDGATYLLLVLMLVCFYSLPKDNALKVVLIVVTIVHSR